MATASADEISAHAAAREGNLEVLSRLVPAVVPVNSVSRGWTLLHSAALKGNTEAIRWLVLDRGADVSVSTPDGFTVLHLLAENNNADATRVLVAAGADVNAVQPGTGLTPLHVCAQHDTVDTATVLLHNGAVVDDTVVRIAQHANSDKIMNLIRLVGSSISHAAPAATAAVAAAPRPISAEVPAKAAAVMPELAPAPSRTSSAAAAAAAPPAPAPSSPPPPSSSWLSTLAQWHGLDLDVAAAAAALLKHDVSDADTFRELTDEDCAVVQRDLSIGNGKKLKRLLDAVRSEDAAAARQSSAAAASVAATPSVAAEAPLADRQRASSDVAAPASASDPNDAPAATAASSLSELTQEDLAVTERFAARLPARYHLPIGDLELGEHLTSGGMGAVMTARLRSTREQCVVKLNKDRDPNAVRRFLREIHISLSVQHRFIVRPLGVAFAPNVTGMEALLVLERGVCSLEDFVAAKRQQQPSATAAEVSDAEIEQYFHFARQIATAMAFLHARGGLHLDQKPSNVVLFSPAVAATTTTTANTQLANVDLSTLNVAKIVDLGLAVLSRKELEEGFGGAAAGVLTHITATSLGATMAYASYEQVNAGPGTQVRPTMDVYSFGAILYRLLCLAKPHAGRNAAEILQHKLFDDAMNEDNLLPAFRSANAARAQAARQLVAVMRMCLQHEPAQRPQTGTDVLRLLLRDDEQLPSELASASSGALSATTSSMSATLERARSGLTAAPALLSSFGSSGSSSSNASVSGQVGGGGVSASTSAALVGVR